MKTIYIVTGAGGHLGNTVVRRLAETGGEIRCLLLPGESEEPLSAAPCRVFYGNVTMRESLREIFECPEDAELVVIHCAGIVNIKSGAQRAVYEVNVNGTRNVADICLEKRVRKLVHVSSVHAIPELPGNAPITEVNHFEPARVEGLYAKTKSEATQYVLDRVKDGLAAVIVHPSGIVGPYDYGTNHMTQLIVDFAKGRLSAGVRGGYDFVDVRDVANGIILAAEKGRSGESYILSNSYVTVPQLLGSLSEVLKRRPIKIYMPMWFAKLTAPFAELYYKMARQKPLYTRYSLYTLTSNGHFSNAKAARELGYRTRSIRRTLEDTVQWLAGRKDIPDGRTEGTKGAKEKNGAVRVRRKGKNVR